MKSNGFILQELDKRFCKVSDLSKQQVSEVTIRNDIQKLEDKEIRTHGDYKNRSSSFS